MRAAVLFGLALMAGCSREPDFDERYDAVSQEIGTKAKEMDAELQSRAKAAGNGAASDQSAPVQAQDDGSRP